MGLNVRSCRIPVRSTRNRMLKVVGIKKSLGDKILSLSSHLKLKLQNFAVDGAMKKTHVTL